MVNKRLTIMSFRLFSIRLWWAHVTVTPEPKRIAVFSNGISYGFKGKIPFGGHSIPKSGVGARLEW